MSQANRVTGTIAGSFSTASAWSAYGDMLAVKKILMRTDDGRNIATWVSNSDLQKIESLGDPETTPFGGTLTTTNELYAEVGHTHMGDQNLLTDLAYENS